MLTRYWHDHHGVNNLLAAVLVVLAMTGMNPTPVTVNVAPNSITGVSLSGTTFTAGTAGTVGDASATLGSGSFTGSFALKTSGVDSFGAGCNNNSVFSISTAGVLSVTSSGAVQSYPGTCVTATQSGLAPFTEAFTITGQSGGGGACSGATPVVPGLPSSFQCDANLSDDFSGTSLDTTKWRAAIGGGTADNVQDCSTQPGFVVEGGGVLTIKQVDNPDGTTVCSAGIQSWDYGGAGGVWPAPPSYIEIKARLSQNGSGGIWFYSYNVPNGSCTFEIDGFGGDNTVGGSGINPLGFTWGIPGYQAGQICGSFSGPFIDLGSLGTSHHVYSYYRPGDGTIRWYMDGNLITSHSGLGGTGWNVNAEFILASPHAEFGSSLLGANPDFMVLDYIKVWH